MRMTSILAVAIAIAAAPASAVTVGSFDSGNCYPFSCNDSGTNVGQSIHYMQIFSASAFAGPISFDTISFAAFTQYTLPAVLNGNYAISFHTTTTGLGAAYPIGPLANSASFFNGALGIPTVASTFSINGTAYNYNPADGNLVMDIVVTNQDNVSNGSGNGYLWADYTGATTTRAYVIGAGTGVSQLGALVTEFNSIPGGVPEPASWAMLIAGFGLTGAAMRRRTKAVAA